MWLVAAFGERAVLHQEPPHRTLADVLWEGRLLNSLAERFPVARPVPLFAGAASAVIGGQLWSCVSFLPGLAPGWDEGYDLAAHGAFLARFHAASADLQPTTRPAPGPELSRLEEATDWALLEEATGPAGTRWYRDELAGTVGELARLGYGELRGQLIHGDFTTLNVVARGRPLRPTGLIDFAHAHVETPLADLAFALWQAGRPRLEAGSLDAARVARVVGGYHSVTPLPDRTEQLLPLLIATRGFVLVARWLARGVVDVAGAVDRLRAVLDRRGELGACVARQLMG
jgi:Ser/Thr protein kinase RdoA (MazF antagonist)